MIEWIPNNFACNSYNGKILITIRFEFNDTSFNSDTFLEIRNVAALSQKCTIRRNLSIASLVGRLQEKYRRISLPRTKLLTRWRISMAYELPVDLAQIRFASQKKSGGGGERGARAIRANGIVFFSHRIRIHRWEIIQVITVYFESLLILFAILI